MPVLVVVVATVLAALDVALTRRRLSADTVAGRTRVGDLVPRAHTLVGGSAVVVWTPFVLAGDRIGEPLSGVVGIVGLGLWWVTALAGLMLLSRWLPSRGDHAGDGPGDSWSSGPALSVLAHLGMVLCVGVFTWAYLTSAV